MVIVSLVFLGFYCVGRSYFFVGRLVVFGGFGLAVFGGFFIGFFLFAVEIIKFIGIYIVFS